MIDSLPYFAGLIDAEGHFGVSKSKYAAKDGERTYKSPRLQIAMTDEDIIRFFAKSLGINNVWINTKRGKENYKPLFGCGKMGSGAIEIAEKLWPWLGNNKRSQIEKVIEECCLDVSLPSESPIRNDEWLAGILDGEGWFMAIERTNGRTKTLYGCPICECQMATLEDMRDIADLMGVETLSTVPPKKDGWLVQYRAMARGTKALSVMKRIRPYVGKRRGEKIDALFTQFSEWHPRQKLTNDKVMSIYQRAWAGEQGTKLAEEFGISSGNVSDIKNGNQHRKITGQQPIRIYQ